MIKLRTEKVNYEVEITLDGQSSKVIVSPLSSSEINELFAKHTKTHADQDYREEIDDLEIRKGRFCLSLVGWSEILDLNGKALECNDENKLNILEHNFDFVNEVFAKVDQITVDSHHMKEEAKKN